jgi:hypothetical protein
MALFVNQQKVKAAAHSMHQFCQEVRDIFPGDTDDRVIETVTVYLYVQLAQDLFGPRFATRLRSRLRQRLKYATPAEVQARVERIDRQAEVFEEAAGSTSSSRSAEDICRTHVTSVIEAMLAEAGYRGEDAELTKKAYMRFEDVIRDIRKHLLGIKEQNSFIMKAKSRV